MQAVLEAVGDVERRARGRAAVDEVSPPSGGIAAIRWPRTGGIRLLESTLSRAFFGSPEQNSQTAGPRQAVTFSNRRHPSKMTAADLDQFSSASNLES